MSKFRNHAVRTGFLISNSASDHSQQLAAQRHELTLTRHYEAHLLSRESRVFNTNLMANPNAAQSLNRLTQHLRGLLKTMAGEEAEPLHDNDPNYDDFASTEGQIQELFTLLEAATERNEGYEGLEGRQDWAVERECEITRLERENEDLRRMLGIDEASLAERGITVDVGRLESGRYSTFLPGVNRRSTGSSDSYSSRLGYWENAGGGGGGGSGNGQPPTPALQRPMDLQPGMRIGPQARRTAIFGGGQQRGGFNLGGSGRGVSLAFGSSPSLWTNPIVNERQGSYKEDTLWT
jgi:hypothetical protein